jgi:ABC-2 type transport system permease protein
LSLRNTARAFPTLLRVGFAGAVAYRAEMLVWVLATTMPLVMLALWTAVAREGAGGTIGRYGQSGFTAYFLGAFIVRQLTGCWAYYEMNFEVRQGTLGMRLLRPIHPLAAFAVENVAAVPMRIVVSLPAAVVVLAVLQPRAMTRDPVLWLLWLAAVLGAWAITLLVNLAVGCTSFFIEQSLKLMDLWLVLYFVLSGYTIPVDLFSPRIRAVIDWLPFRYQLGFPVDVMTGAIDRSDALALLARQWGWVAVAAALTALLWRRVVARFAAHGG